MNFASQQKMTHFLTMLCLVVICMIAGNAVRSADAQESDNPAIIITTDTDPEGPVAWGTDVTVQIQVAAQQESQCPTEVSVTPVDVVLVIDTSGSMDEAAGGVTKMEAALQAAQVFVDQLNLSSDKIAVVQFSWGASTSIGLNQSVEDTKNAIGGLSASGSTDLSSGLTEANSLVEGLTDNDRTSVVIVISDGQPNNPDSAREAANQLKDNGIRLVTIGLGDNRDADYLQSIASTPADYYDAPDPTQLDQIYVEIAQNIRKFTAAADIVLQYTYDRDNFELNPDSITGGGQLEGDVITWRFEKLLDGDSETVSLTVRPTQIGDFSVGQPSVSYVQCETQLRNDIPAAGPIISSSDALPTATPVVSTATPAVPLATPTVPALMASSTSDTSSAFFGSSFCGTGWWSWLPWLLVLLALLYLLWWWFKGDLQDRIRDEGCLCRLLRLAFYLSLLLLLWLVGRELAATLCPPRDTVYFWRMENGQTGIYLTYPGSAVEPQPFSSVNSEGCVGCHAVSNEANMIIGFSNPSPAHGMIYNLDGGTRVIPGTGISGNYAGWSPDGTMLAIATSNEDIAIFTLANGELIPLEGASEAGVVETMPSWSADGSRIAFVRSEGAITELDGIIINQPTDIYTVPAQGGEAQPLLGASSDGFNYYPAYSPDGKWLAFTHHNNVSTYADPMAEVFIVDADGGSPIRLLANDGPAGAALTGVSNSWPSWSLDGQWLAFNSKRQDESFDIFVTQIGENGQSGEALSLAGASKSGIFEHLPSWGEAPPLAPLWARLLALWPWLLLPLLIALLRWLICRPKIVKESLPPPPNPVSEDPPPPLVKWVREPVWTPEPALIIGLGGSGRTILTQVKKNLLDAGKGKWLDQVQLLLLDSKASQRDEQTIFAGSKLDPAEIVTLGKPLKDRLNDPNLTRDAAYRGWAPVILRTMSDEITNTGESTHGQRGLGRLDLIEDVRQGQESTILRALRDKFTTARNHARTLNNPAVHPDRLRVILVGSLAGGLGSGIVFDIAYIARLIAQEMNIPEASVLGHLILSDAFANLLEGNGSSAELNTAAAMRELERFQLAEARAFPMIYQEGGSAPLDTLVQSLLLDEIYLYDGDRDPSPLTSKKLEIGIFPAIADSITLWLDVASRQGQLHSARNNMTMLTNELQFTTGVAHMSALGIYQYRLPIRDIVEQMSVRFAREVLHALTLQASSEIAGLTLETAIEPADFAERLVMGDTAVALCPRIWRDTLSRWAFDGDHASQPSVSIDVEAEINAWNRYLDAAVGILLNGHQSKDKRILANRSGGLGQALAVLQALVDSHDTEPVLHKILNTSEVANHPDLKRLVDGAIESTRALRVQLLQQQQTLRNYNVGGVEQLLSLRAQGLDQQRRQMDSILVRGYLWEDEQGRPLADVWYQTHLAGRVKDGTRQLYWSHDQAGNWRLTLYGVGDHPMILDEAEAFTNALMELGLSYAAPFYDRHVGDLLKDGILADDMRPAIAQTLLNNSNVLLGYDRDNAPASQRSLIVSAGSHLEDARGELLETIRYYDPDANEPLILQTTDPFVLVIAQVADLISLEAVLSIMKAYATYDHAYRGRQEARMLAQRTVFEAEALALRVEMKLPEILRREARRLHPVVVTGLANGQKALAYFMLLIHGDVQLNRVGGQASIMVQMPDSEPIVIPLEPPDDPLHGLIAGLIVFSQHIDDEQAALLVQRYRANPTDLRGRWQQWYDAGHQALLEQADVYNAQIMRDFVAAAIILVYMSLPDKQ